MQIESYCEVIFKPKITLPNLCIKSSIKCKKSIPKLNSKNWALKNRHWKITDRIIFPLFPSVRRWNEPKNDLFPEKILQIIVILFYNFIGDNNNHLNCTPFTTFESQFNIFEISIYESIQMYFKTWILEFEQIVNTDSMNITLIRQTKKWCYSKDISISQVIFWVGRDCHKKTSKSLILKTSNK